MLNQFHDVVIKPFTEIFHQFVMNLAAKLELTILYILIMFYEFVQEAVQAPAPEEVVVALIATPLEYWYGLFILTFMDFFFGSIRALTEKEIQWRWAIFVRGAYKFVVYAAVLVVTATATNMFPMIFGIFQYAVVAILAAYETYSFFKNVYLLAVLYAALDVMQGRRPPGISFTQLVDMRDKELMREKRTGLYKHSHKPAPSPNVPKNEEQDKSKQKD